MREDIELDKLNIDAAYQRHMVPSVIAAIVRYFIAEAFGCLQVGRREDGSLWIADGQQRFTAAKKMEWPRIPCETFPSRGRAHEAEIYYRINGNRRKVSANDLFRAACEAGHDNAIAIVAAVERSGFELAFHAGSNKQPHQIRQAHPLEVMHDWGGVELIELALSIIRSTWPREHEATSAYILKGLGRFLHKYPLAETKRVVRCLRDVSPAHLLRHADDAKQLLGGGRDAVICKAILIRYNQRLSESKRLVEL